jgi:hypothetical protein
MAVLLFMCHVPIGLLSVMGDEGKNRVGEISNLLFRMMWIIFLGNHFKILSLLLTLDQKLWSRAR